MNVRVGRVGKLFAHGYSDCKRCHTPWFFVEPRVVDFTPSFGGFALCEKCWAESSLGERLAFNEECWRECWHQSDNYTHEEMVVGVVAASRKEDAKA